MPCTSPSAGGRSYQEIISSGPSFTAWAQLRFADTFDVVAGGPTTVGYRCLRIGSPAMYGEDLDLTLFRTG